MRRIRPVLTALMLTCLALSSLAQEPILLSIEAAGEQHRLSRADLAAYPQFDIRTETPYTDGVQTFTGPSLKAVFDRLNLNVETFRMRALNDYVVDTSLAELANIDPILAIERNGQPMAVREKGPIWLMLPLSDRPELDNPAHHRLLIWQLHRIEVD